ncbi:MAG: AI-2E family transporter [Planctomycetes bacterium]|nr:AI-2E family transporter [Planctomycetota bacterium]
MASPADEPAPVSHTGVFTRERLTAIVLLAVTAIALYLCYRIAQPFLPALTWALALAVIARPVHHRIARRIPSRNVAAAISVTLVTLLILAPVVLLTWRVASQASRYASYVEQIDEEVIEEKVQSIASEHPRLKQLVDWMRRNMQAEQSMRRMFAGVGGGLSSTVSGTFWVAAQLLITLFVLFFLFRDEPQAIAAVREILPLPSEEKDQVLARADDTIHATIYGTVVVAAVQGFLGGLMFWWLGLPAPVFWGLVMGALAIVPYLGAFFIWAPAAVWLAMEGEFAKAAILTLWGTVVVGLIDNLLYPILVGKRLRQHTLIAFIAIIGGLAVFGASGIVLGPVIVTMTGALLNIWWRRTSAGRAADENHAA